MIKLPQKGQLGIVEGKADSEVHHQHGSTRN